MQNLLLRDLAIANTIAIVFTIILFGVGWNVINSISISYLILSALLLILGGALGFFLSSVSFYTLIKFFSRSGEKEESEVEKRQPRSKTKAEEGREQINLGKRMIITGLVLLCESFLISLILII
jgi:hypothetical protein